MAVFFWVPLGGHWAFHGIDDFDLRTAVALLASAVVGVLLAPASRPTTVGRKVLAVFGAAAAVLGSLLVGFWLVGLGFTDFMVSAGLAERPGPNGIEPRPDNFFGVIFTVLALAAVVHAALALLAIACAVAAPVSALLALGGRPTRTIRPAKPGASPDRGE
jgi:cytochrome bd-type quinol oxidase subunit 1